MTGSNKKKTVFLQMDIVYLYLGQVQIKVVL